MEIFEKRRSIRKYKKTPVDESLIMKLIKTASLTPSGHNTQPWHFIIVNNDDIKTKIAEVSHQQYWMLRAPVFIVCVADIRSRIKDDEKISLDENSSLSELKLIIRDTAISIHQLMLEALDNGLGTCWVGWYKQRELRPILGIPEDKYVVGVVTVGYADESPDQRPRKNFNDIIHRDKW